VARGLALNAAEYKQHLMNCDSPRRNDLDGRGALSEEALAEFTKFFLKTCLDQVRFMEQLIQPDRLRDRILLWAEEEARAGTLPAKSGQVLEAVLFRGASFQHCSIGVCSLPRVPARRCSSPSRRLWRRDGCPDCSRSRARRKGVKRKLTFRI
jgi:hypothetical protein